MSFFNRFNKKASNDNLESHNSLVSETPPKPRENLYTKISLCNTVVCKNKLRDISVIHDKLNGDRIISWNEALHLYYGDKSRFFPWNFPVSDVELFNADVGFSVFGDKIHLGDVLKDERRGSDYWLLRKLIDVDGIQKLKCNIKNRSDYFHVTSYEYHNTEGFNPEKDDQFNRGTEAWFDQNNPSIDLCVYFDPSVIDAEINPQSEKRIMINMYYDG